MKKLTLLFAVLFALCSCTQQAEAPKEEMDEVGKKNLEIVLKTLKAHENEDVETYMAAFAENALFYGPAYGPADTLSEKMSESQTKWLETVDSIQYNVFAQLAHTEKEGDMAGDWVMIWCNPSWYDIKTGKKVQIFAHFTMRMEDGKIVQEASFWDTWDMAKQLGAELNWPEDEKKE